MQGVRVCSHLHDQRTPPKMSECVKDNRGIGSTPEARMQNYAESPEQANGFASVLSVLALSCVSDLKPCALQPCARGA